MLVITGRQRSGTSAVAALFKAGGYEIDSWWDEEAQGGSEDTEICELYRRLLGDSSFPFEDFQEYSKNLDFGISLPELESRFSWRDNEVVKFSYLLMNPAFVTIWHKYRFHVENLFDDKFLILFRSPEEIVASKNRKWNRFQHDSLLLQQDVGALTWNFDQCVKLLIKFKYRFAFVQWNFLLESSDTLNSALRYLKVDFQVSEELWKDVIYQR